MKPSIFRQLEAVAIEQKHLKPSPRHWNCGLLRYRDRLWMSYRFHLREPGSRCALAIVEIDPKTLQPCGSSQLLKFSGPTGTEHHEDGRLFMFRGKPHIAYTEMRGYRPGVDYLCVVKYARLKLIGSNWRIDEVFHPQWGKNDGRGKEKNWILFECAGELYAIYETTPRHVILHLREEKVLRTHETLGPVWHFGIARGGTPPVLMPDGQLMAIFHSRVNTEVPPHHVRYYGAAYTFQKEPPFTPLRVSTRPVMVASEADGHQVDPRFVDGWKPFVVFPCGLVPDGDGWLSSLGVNDWQCAIAKLRPDQLFLGAANGSDIQPRYFRTENGSKAVKLMTDAGSCRMLPWSVPRWRPTGAGVGYMKCTDPREAQSVAETPGVTEVSFAEFDGAFLVAASTSRMIGRNAFR